LGLVALAVLFIILNALLPIPKELYMTMMNVLIAVEVACGFLVIFYRFITFERR
jgi:hypothetical protein